MIPTPPSLVPVWTLQLRFVFIYFLGKFKPNQLLPPVHCTAIGEEAMQKWECKTMLGVGGIASFNTSAILWQLALSIELQHRFIYLKLPLRKMQIEFVFQWPRKLKGKNAILWWKVFWEQNTITSCNRVFFSSCQSLLPRFYTVSEIIINNSKKKKKEKQTNKQKLYSSKQNRA